MKKTAEDILKKLQGSLKISEALVSSKKKAMQKKAMKSIYESDFVKTLSKKPVGSKIQKSLSVVISEANKCKKKKKK